MRFDPSLLNFTTSAQRSATHGQPDSTIWFDDGNLVLKVSSPTRLSSDSAVLFRVHGFMLMFESPGFSALLTPALLGDDSDMERYEGVPVAHLEENAEAVHVVLCYLYGIPCVKFHITAPRHPLISPLQYHLQYGGPGSSALSLLEVPNPIRPPSHPSTSPPSLAVPSSRLGRRRISLRRNGRQMHQPR